MLFVYLTSIFVIQLYDEAKNKIEFIRMQILRTEQRISETNNDDPSPDMVQRTYSDAR